MNVINRNGQQYRASGNYQLQPGETKQTLGGSLIRGAAPAVATLPFQLLGNGPSGAMSSVGTGVEATGNILANRLAQLQPNSKLAAVGAGATTTAGSRFSQALRDNLKRTGGNPMSFASAGGAGIQGALEGAVGALPGGRSLAAGIEPLMGGIWGAIRGGGLQSFLAGLSGGARNIMSSNTLGNDIPEWFKKSKSSDYAGGRWGQQALPQIPEEANQPPPPPKAPPPPPEMKPYIEQFKGRNIDPDNPNNINLIAPSDQEMREMTPEQRAGMGRRLANQMALNRRTADVDNPVMAKYNAAKQQAQAEQQMEQGIPVTPQNPQQTAQANADQQTEQDIDQPHRDAYEKQRMIKESTARDEGEPYQEDEYTPPGSEYYRKLNEGRLGHETPPAAPVTQTAGEPAPIEQAVPSEAGEPAPIEQAVPSEAGEPEAAAPVADATAAAAPAKQTESAPSYEEATETLYDEFGNPLVDKNNVPIRVPKKLYDDEGNPINSPMRDFVPKDSEKRGYTAEDVPTMKNLYESARKSPASIDEIGNSPEEIINAVSAARKGKLSKSDFNTAFGIFSSKNKGKLDESDVKDFKKKFYEALPDKEETLYDKSGKPLKDKYTFDEEGNAKPAAKLPRDFFKTYTDPKDLDKQTEEINSYLKEQMSKPEPEPEPEPKPKGEVPPKSTRRGVANISSYAKTVSAQGKDGEKTAILSPNAPPRIREMLGDNAMSYSLAGAKRRDEEKKYSKPLDRVIKQHKDWSSLENIDDKLKYDESKFKYENLSNMKTNMERLQTTELPKLEQQLNEAKQAVEDLNEYDRILNTNNDRLTEKEVQTLQRVMTRYSLPDLGNSYFQSLLLTHTKGHRQHKFSEAGWNDLLANDRTRSKAANDQTYAQDQLHKVNDDIYKRMLEIQKSEKEKPDVYDKHRKAIQENRKKAAKAGDEEAGFIADFVDKFGDSPFTVGTAQRMWDEQNFPERFRKEIPWKAKIRRYPQTPQGFLQYEYEKRNGNGR